MRVYIKLGLNSECHSYDIYQGAFKSLGEAIDSIIFEYAALGANLGYVTHSHTHEDYGEAPHTHIVLFNKKGGTISEEKLIEALEYYDENTFCGDDYIIIRTFAIVEVAL